MATPDSPAPTKALECLDCSSITRSPDATDFDRCPQCGSDATTVVTLTSCPAPDPATCTDEDHHWGLDMHSSTTADRKDE